MLLTYVLAALAAALSVTIIVSGWHYIELIDGIVDGRYRVVAMINPLIEFVFRFAGYLIALGLVTLSAVRLLGSDRLFKNALASCSSGLEISVFVFAVVIIGYGIFSGFESAQQALSSLSFWSELAIVGLVWGSVFWLRQPKRVDTKEVFA